MVERAGCANLTIYRSEELGLLGDGRSNEASRRRRAMSQVCRTIKLAVLPSTEPIFSERCFTVEIDDEAAGEFVVLKQNGQSVGISPDEWPMLRTAINQMIGYCRQEGGAEQ